MFYIPVKARKREIEIKWERGPRGEKVLFMGGGVNFNFYFFSFPHTLSDSFYFPY